MYGSPQIAVLRQAHAQEAFVVPEIQVRLPSVVEDEHFSVLERGLPQFPLLLLVRETSGRRVVSWKRRSPWFRRPRSDTDLSSGR